MPTLSQQRFIALLEAAEAVIASYDHLCSRLESLLTHFEPGSIDYCGVQTALTFLPDIDFRHREVLIRERIHHDATVKRNARQRRYLARRSQRHSTLSDSA